jgi:hypothetical protein
MGIDTTGGKEMKQYKNQKLREALLALGAGNAEGNIDPEKLEIILFQLRDKAIGGYILRHSLDIDGSNLWKLERVQ